MDNDAGGIFTYSAAGARWGYLPLWTLLPITIALIITQEMCSRMGAVTGKGLSDLIREEFGLRITFLMMTLLVLVNLTNVMSDFAGIASSLELFHISRYISVPLSAAAVWLLIVKGNYAQRREDLSVRVCVLCDLHYLRHSGQAGLERGGASIACKPVLAAGRRLHRDADRDGGNHHRALDAVLSSGRGGGEGNYGQGIRRIADRGDRRLHHDRRSSRFFIIVACAGAIYTVQPRDINRRRGSGASGLKPFGQYAFLLFCAGLFNASLFAACILPLSTAYSVCEGLGFESGVNRRFRRGADLLLALHPADRDRRRGGADARLSRWYRMILLSQVINGVLLPVVLIFMIILINKRDLMQEWVNSRWYNLVSWTTVVVMIGLTLAFAGITIKGLR